MKKHLMKTRKEKSFRNSLAAVTFFRFEKKIIFSIFPLFLHLCNRNSLAGFVNFFRFEKKIIFLFSYCFYIFVVETHQLDVYIFFIIIFLLAFSYVGETHQLDLYIFFPTFFPTFPHFPIIFTLMKQKLISFYLHVRENHLLDFKHVVFEFKCSFYFIR